MITFSFITNDPELAKMAYSAGVGRLFVDLEIIGKCERQGHLDTVISSHSFNDISVIRKAVPDAELLVRLNPIHNGTSEEINHAIDNGADLLMLPMFETADQVERFSELADGRVGVVPLLETPASVIGAEGIAKVPGVVELYVGLNDLHLALNQKFMFQPIADSMIDPVAKLARDNNLRFGFGGIARIGEGFVPGEMVLAEHVRLKSESVILSRTFFRPDDPERPGEDPFQVFSNEIKLLREEEERLNNVSDDELDQIHQNLVENVHQIVTSKSGKDAESHG